MKRILILLFVAAAILSCNGKNTEHSHGEDNHQHDVDGNHIEAETQEKQEEFVVSDTVHGQEHGHEHAEGQEHAH
jgi:hypothetical protein